MFGFVFGTVCLFFLARLAMGRRGCRGGWHGRFRSPRGYLKRVFEDLDTSPSQERAILEAVGDVREQGASVRRSANQTREQLAALLRQDTLDTGAIEAALEAQRDTVHTIKHRFAEALAKVHSVLDASQRKCLANRIERGFFMNRMGSC